MRYKILNDKNTQLIAWNEILTQFGVCDSLHRLLSQKTNQDHRARLVSSNRENFRMLTVRQYDTFSLRGGN